MEVWIDMNRLTKAVILVIFSFLFMSACSLTINSKTIDNQSNIDKPSKIQQEVDNTPDVEYPDIINNDNNDNIENTPEDDKNNNHNTTDNWHHDGKDLVDKTKLANIDYEIQYYGYKSDYAKLYKIIPNIDISSHDGITTIKCKYSESISKSDTLRAVDLLISGILNIPLDSTSIIEDEPYIIYNISFDVFNEQFIKFSEQLNDINTYENDWIRKIRCTNNNSEIHVYLNSLLEGRPNEVIDFEIRTLLYLEVYNLVNFYSSNNSDESYSQKVKIFELDSNSNFLNSVTYSIVNYSDYNGIWTGFDNIGYDTFYPILLNNIIITPEESNKIKIEMPTNIPGYTQEYLSRFYISLFEFFPTNCSLYSDYQNTLYCYMTEEEYAKVVDIISKERLEFIDKHLNISDVEYINNIAKFTVIDTNFPDTSSDYYQYLTVEILNNKFNTDKEKDITDYKILVYNRDNELKTVIKCNTKIDKPLIIVELGNLIYGNNSENACIYFNKLIEEKETVDSFEFTMNLGIISIIENCIRTQLENENTEFVFEVDFENTSIHDILAVINYIDTLGNGVVSLKDNKICLTLDKISFECAKKHIDNEVKDILKNLYGNNDDFTESMITYSEDSSKSDVYGYRLLAELMECVNIKPNVDIN